MSSGSDPLLWEADIPSDLHDPVLIMHLDGWIDAGYAGQTAVGQLKSQIRTHRLVQFDPDTFIDYRARRPTMRLVNGVNSELRWPRLQIRHGRDVGGQHVLVLSGPEPDMAWHKFVDALMGIVDQLSVRMAIGLGAFPGPGAHTRPIRLSSSASTAELAARVGFTEAVIDVPGGVQSAIERAFADRNKPAVGIWARVPHYAAAMPYPGAAAAVLDCVASLTGLAIDTSQLQSASTLALRQIDDLIANNPEHQAMVRQMEEQVDAETAAGGPTLGDASALPSGDELAAEIQRFLRDQGS